MSDRDPLLQHHLELFGTVHPSLGRVLKNNPRRKTADFRGELVQPRSHAEQEAYLRTAQGFKPHPVLRAPKDVQAGASAYAGMLHLPDPHLQTYDHIMTNPDRIRELGRAYEALPHHDKSAEPAFHQMRREINDQFDHATKRMGIKYEVTSHDPYPDAQHMIDDVTKNKRLRVLSTKTTGGHPFLSDEDNDKFRFVHDLFGHAATGRSFDRHGEDAAWAAHSRMFTPLARGAMSSETRGQNGAMCLNGEFQDQKTAILPRHLWDDEAVKHATAALSYTAFLTRKVAHDSGDAVTIMHCPFCGSGQVIARSDGTTECQHCGTCFNVTVQPMFSAYPQSIDGQPVQVPGMPPRTPPMDPALQDPNAGPADPDADPDAAPFPPDADGAPDEDPEADGDDEGDDSDDGSPFAKKSMMVFRNIG